MTDEKPKKPTRSDLYGNHKVLRETYNPDSIVQARNNKNLSIGIANYNPDGIVKARNQTDTNATNSSSKKQNKS